VARVIDYCRVQRALVEHQYDHALALCEASLDARVDTVHSTTDASRSPRRLVGAREGGDPADVANDRPSMSPSVVARSPSIWTRLLHLLHAQLLWIAGRDDAAAHSCARLVATVAASHDDRAAPLERTSIDDLLAVCLSNNLACVQHGRGDRTIAATHVLLIHSVRGLRRLLSPSAARPTDVASHGSIVRHHLDALVHNLIVHLLASSPDVSLARLTQLEAAMLAAAAATLTTTTTRPSRLDDASREP
jgi:hypothetical protein